MGAVKNLFVRIGTDATGAVKGFKDASSAGANAEKSIKKSSAKTKQSIRDAFTSSVPSIKEYTAQIAQTKSRHETATQNVSRLKDEISRLTGIYDTVKNATEGLDLSKPLEELMVDAEKSLTTIESRRRKLEAELNSLTSNPKTANSKRTAALQAELSQLAEKSSFAQDRLANLDRIAETVGSENMGYASIKGLEQLQQKIAATENELRSTQMVADETGRSLKSMGVGPYIGKALKGIGTAAAQAAGTGVRKLWSGLKNVAGSVGRGIASLPGKLRNIGKTASASTGGLMKMVRSIRNIGIASLGMKAFGLVFGELRSVITDYLGKNEELNQTIQTMKSQLGEALAPAINIVVVALQRLMPLVTAVSSGINSIFKTLFGDIAATSKKIESAADELNTYGFDQITKESDSESDSASSSSSPTGEQSALVTKLTNWIQQLKAAFLSGDWKTLGGTLAAGINGVFAAIDEINVGEKLGNIINAVVTTVHSLFSGIDFRSIGEMLGSEMTAVFQSINWNTVGETIGMFFTMLPSLVTGWILGTDWAVIGSSLSSCLISTLDTVTAWIQETDWKHIGESLSKIFDDIDWEYSKKTLMDGFSSVLEAIGSLASGFPPLQGIDFTAVTESLQGLWQSVWDFAELVGGTLAEAYNTVLKPILGWVIEDAVPASVDVFTAAFDALSAVLKPVTEGLDGLMAGLEPVITFIEDTAMVALDGLKGIFEKVGRVFSEKGEKITNIVSGIGEIITIVWKLIEPQMMYLKGLVGAVFGYIGDTISNTVGWLINLFSGLIDFVVGIFTGDWERAWDGVVGIFDGIVDGIKGTINSVISFINGLISGVCDGINTIIKAMNRLKWDVPDWVPILGGKTFGFNLKTIAAPQIPLLEKGGVLEKGQVGILEGNGDEAVVPLEKNTGWIDTLADKLTSKMPGFSGGGGGSATFQFYLGSRKITEYVVKDINQITRENGVCPIHV